MIGKMPKCVGWKYVENIKSKIWYSIVLARLAPHLTELVANTWWFSLTSSQKTRPWTTLSCWGGSGYWVVSLEKGGIEAVFKWFFMCFRFYKVPLMTHSLKWVFLFFLVNPWCFLSRPVEIEALWRVHAEELGSGNKPPWQNCQPQFGVGRLKGGQNGHSWRLEELNSCW